MKYAYSPDTGEFINTATPAAWMLTTTIAPPIFDPQVAGLFFRNGAWVIVTSTALADAQILEKTAVLNQVRAVREIALNRLTGLQLNTTVAATISAIQAARTALLNITADAGVIAAVDGAGTRAAISAVWLATSAALTKNAPSAAGAFAGLTTL